MAEIVRQAEGDLGADRALSHDDFLDVFWRNLDRFSEPFLADAERLDEIL